MNNYNEDSSNGKSQPPNLSSFRIDKRMLPESPETFMRNWENSRSAGLSNTKSPIRESNTVKKEPVMIHHIKGKTEHELNKSATPEKIRGGVNNVSSANELFDKDIYRNNYYGDAEFDMGQQQNTMFIYECGHCLSGNMKGGPNPRKINSLCPSCASISQKGSGNKYNWSGTKSKG